MSIVKGVRPAMHVDLTKLGYTRTYQPTTTSLTYQQGTGQDLTFTIKTASGTDDSIKHFDSLTIGDKKLTIDEDFSVKEGSTIITVKHDTLDDFSTGSYTVTVAFDNGAAVTLPLEIKAATTTPNEDTGDTAATITTTSPQTGDPFSPVLYITLLALAIISAPRIIKNRKNCR